jgi:beta-glucosidase
LTAEFGKAFIIGAQGPVSQSKVGLGAEQVACTAKHFIGYSLPQSGINLGPTLIGEREMRSTFLEPFSKAIKAANIYSVMPSYSEIDGEPVHASKFLLRDILRDELGFNGYTISDYLGISMLTDFQKVAADRKTAAYQSLIAGVDLEAPDFDTYTFIPELVKSGQLAMEIVDEAVANILRIKFQCGLFDNDFNKCKSSSVHTESSVALTRQLAEESIILLKNSNSTLPLSKTGLNKLAVIGPNADQVQFGDYCWTNNKKYGVTVFAGLKAAYSDSSEVVTTPGCDIWQQDSSNIEAAVRMGAAADKIVLVLGGSSLPLGGVGWEINDPNNTPICGEGYDRDKLTPPGRQMELFNAIYELGKPLIVVLLHGRPWAITEIAAKADAIIEAWYPGEQGGNAIADIITGKVNPSGRLAVSIPRSVGQMPLYYNRRPSGNGYYLEPGSKSKPGRDYVFESPYPLYPFGFGLSYTEFEYGKMILSKSNITLTEPLKVSITVKNIGSRTGSEVVQLYINDLVSSVTTPIKVLRAFSKVKLTPGQITDINFDLEFEDFALWNRQMKQVIEPGQFEIMIGRSAEEIVAQKTVEFNANN